MPYVPYYSILRCIKNTVKRQAQFNNTEIGCKVPPLMSYFVKQKATYFLCKSRYIRFINFPKILRTVYFIKKEVKVCLP